MKIVVTGASGFLGGAIVRNLQGYEAKVLAIAGPRGTDAVSYANILWQKYNNLESTVEAIATFRPDVVVNCANYYTLQNDQSSVDRMMLANFVLPAKISGIRISKQLHFINLGSYFQYQGPNASTPNSKYAEIKQATSDHLAALSCMGHIALSDLVVYDIYGPNDPRQKIIPSVISSLLMGTRLLIRAPKSKLNLVYLSDAVHAVTQIAMEKLTGRYSISALTNCAVIDVVRHLERISGSTSQIVFSDEEPLAKPVLGRVPVVPNWSPSVSLEDGLSSCWKAATA